MVYIVQEPLKREEGSGNMIAAMDFKKAMEYGDLAFCLPGGKVSLTPAPTIRMLKEKLKNFSDNDFLIPTGDPTAIAMAAIIASRVNNGRIKFLKWDKVMKRYIQIDAIMN